MTAFCRLQTWIGGQEEHGNELFESAEQILLEFSPYHLCGRAKFAGMIFHLINDVETNFKEEVAGCGPEQVAWLSLSVSVWTSRNSALIGNWKYDTMLPAGPGYTRFFGQFTKTTYRGIFTQVFQNLKKHFIWMVDKLNLVARSAWVMEELLEFEIELKLLRQQDSF